MKNLFKAIGFTILVVLAIIITLATLYITMWLVIGIAIVMLLVFTFKVLQAKENL
jgi:hypothetical protein